MKLKTLLAEILVKAAFSCVALGVGVTNTAHAQGTTLTISPGDVPIGIDPSAPSGGTVLSIGSEPTTMAFCRPGGLPYLQVNYTIIAPNQTVLHRVGVYDGATGEVLYDIWQQQTIEGGTTYPIRYLNAPPSGHYWAPFVEVYTWINGQWQFSFSHYVPVDYNYTYCA